MARIVTGYYFPINPELCVYPTEPFDEQETQFEAFQSVLANILSADEDSPYVWLASTYGLSVTEIGDPMDFLPDGIYYYPEEQGSTHYVAVRGGSVYDPYDYFQPPDTQGFCQLFAFFLAVNDVQAFQVIPKGLRNTTQATFDKYVHNTYTALQKLLELLDSDRALDVRMRASFQRVPPADYGIRCRSYDRFKRDLARLTLTDVRFYIIDQSIPVDSHAQRDRLWAYAWRRFDEEG